MSDRHCTTEASERRNVIAARDMAKAEAAAAELGAGPGEAAAFDPVELGPHRVELGDRRAAAQHRVRLVSDLVARDPVRRRDDER